MQEQIIDVMNLTTREGRILGPLLHKWNPKEESFTEFYNKIFVNQPERLNPETRKGCESLNTTNK